MHGIHTQKVGASKLLQLRALFWIFSVFTAALFITLAAPAARADTVVATITIPSAGQPPTGADAIAITPNGQYAYVTNDSTNTVSVIDTASNTLVGNPIAISTSAAGITNMPSIAITPDGQYAYVLTHGAGGSVSVINTASNTVVAGPIIPISPTSDDYIPTSIAITPDGQYAYVTNFNTPGRVGVIDTASNTVVGSPIVVGYDPSYIAITPDGRYAYIACNDGSTIDVLDMASSTVASTISTDAYHIAFTPDGRYAYVTSGLGNGIVLIIDTASNTIISTLTLGGGSIPGDIAITPDGQYAYVVNDGTNTVSVIDTASNTVVGSPIAVGQDPLGIAITPDGQYVYVANHNYGSTVSVIKRSVATSYTVTSSVNGTGGTISPLGVVPVTAGSTQTFTVTPNAGYLAIMSGSTCGGTLSGNTYTTKPITTACTVTAGFAKIPTSNLIYVTASAGAGGVITPSGVVSVTAGSTKTFTVTPNAGYLAIMSGSTCGGTLSGNTYTTKPITTACTVTAGFLNMTGLKTQP